MAPKREDFVLDPTADPSLARELASWCLERMGGTNGDSAWVDLASSEPWSVGSQAAVEYLEAVGIAQRTPSANELVFSSDDGGLVSLSVTPDEVDALGSLIAGRSRLVRAKEFRARQRASAEDQG